MRIALALGLALVAAAAQADPAAPGDPPAACTAFDWPLAREAAWFPGLAPLDSGATVAAGQPGAALRLRPTAEVAFPVPPSRRPAEDSLGGVLRFPAPAAPGLYQVTLSDEAWIDLSQDGATTLPTAAHTGKRGCPGLRKSVRYRLGPEPVIVLISGAQAEAIRVVLAPAE